MPRHHERKHLERVEVIHRMGLREAVEGARTGNDRIVPERPGHRPIEIDTAVLAAGVTDNGHVETIRKVRIEMPDRGRKMWTHRKVTPLRLAVLAGGLRACCWTASGVVAASRLLQTNLMGDVPRTRHLATALPTAPVEYMTADEPITTQDPAVPHRASQ